MTFPAGCTICVLRAEVAWVQTTKLKGAKIKSKKIIAKQICECFSMRLPPKRKNKSQGASKVSFSVYKLSSKRRSLDHSTCQPAAKFFRLTFSCKRALSRTKMMARCLCKLKSNRD